MNLVQLFHSSVEKYPAKECIRYKNGGQYQSYSYQELWNIIRCFAAGLQACGIEKGDRVGILASNCPEWPITDLASLSIQAVVVPVYPTLPSIQIHYILQHAGVKCLIVQDETQLQKIYENWPQTLKKVILIQSEHVIADHRILTFSNVLRSGNVIQKDNENEIINGIDENQLATIVYTSGTSGTPKGVMLSHKNIVSNVLASTTYVPVSHTDISLSYLPLSHIFERTVGQYAAFSFGATIAYAESIDTILQNLQEVRPTLLITVPRLLEKVYARIQERIGKLPKPIRSTIHKGLRNTSHKGITYRLVDSMIYNKVREGLGGNMRMIVSGGAGLAANIAEFFMKADIPVQEGYGMTETAPVICCNPWGRARPGTVGRPIPGVEVATAEDGELLVKGPNVMLGYYNSPEETSKTISDDGWLHTGDIAEINDGYVKIVDRKKNLIVLATGKNVAPWPVENAIALSTYISEVIFVGDRRQYITCLVFPDFQTLLPIAEQLQLGEDKRNWVAHPKIQDLIRKEIVSRAASFASFEQPKRALIMPYELSLDAGELTPTLKIRNQIIMQKYASLIEDMYNGKNYIPITESSKQHEQHHDSDTYSTLPTSQDIPSQDIYYIPQEKEKNSEPEQQPQKPYTQVTPNNKHRSLFGYVAAGILLGFVVRIFM